MIGGHVAERFVHGEAHARMAVPLEVGDGQDIERSVRLQEGEVAVGRLYLQIVAADQATQLHQFLRHQHTEQRALIGVVAVDIDHVERDFLEVRQDIDVQPAHMVDFDPLRHEPGVVQEQIVGDVAPRQGRRQLVVGVLLQLFRTKVRQPGLDAQDLSLLAAIAVQRLRLGERARPGPGPGLQDRERGRGLRGERNRGGHEEVSHPLALDTGGGPAEIGPGGKQVLEKLPVGHGTTATAPRSPASRPCVRRRQSRAVGRQGVRFIAQHRFGQRHEFALHVVPVHRDARVA